jgi:hypothetical protein
VNQFACELKKEEAGHVLYRGMMVALGYSKNKLLMRELANHLPLHIIERRSAPERQALLFGLAGLLPSQRGITGEEAYVKRIERSWAAMKDFSIVREVQWHLSHLRPLNSPLRRLAAMDCLLERCQEGLLARIVRLARESLSRGAPGILEDGLIVGAAGYSAEHFDFDCGQHGKSRLLGRGRARVMVVDIVLPFIYAWGQAEGEHTLSAWAFDLYKRYPPLPENYITRQMKAQLLPRGGANPHKSARIQQGMIHLYQNFCRTGRGESCELFGNSSVPGLDHP